MNDESTKNSSQNNAVNNKVTRATRLEICPNTLSAITIGATLLGHIILLMFGGGPGG